jgi:hypothetical protein
MKPTDNMVKAALSALNAARVGSRGPIPKQAVEKAIVAALAARIDYMPTMDEACRFMASNPQTSAEMIAELTSLPAPKRTRLTYDKAKQTIMAGGRPLNIKLEDTDLA